MFHNCFWSNHVVEQLSFSMFLLFLTFDFDLILGSFLTVLGPNGLFLGSEWGSKSDIGSTHVVEQLLFCICSSIMTFDFDLVIWSFFTF